MTKIVYQTDLSGRFIGRVEADESPLERGVYLIPAGCVEVAPPWHGDGHVPVWHGSGWTIVPEHVADAVADAGGMPMRDAWRAVASMDRAAFLKSLVRLGLMPVADAVAAARGEWPECFATAIGDLPVDPIEAQIDWASATRVARLHPVFMALLAHHADGAGLDEAEAVALGDAVFGWPEPSNEATPEPGL